MALTKVSPPVTAISKLDNTTTVIDIPTAASDIDIDVAGLDVLDIGQTTITLDDLVTLVGKNVLTELIAIKTTAGAEGVVDTDATKMRVGTTTLDPLEILTNAIPRMTVAATGAVALGVTGVNADELVDKNYVDTSSPNLSVALADLIAANTTTGSVQVPNSTGNDLIFNWGLTASISSTSEVVTFDTPFPNAIFVGFATRNIVTQGDNAAHAGNYTLTTMEVSQTGSASSTVAWLAIGF